jgi:hypothetical protein
MDVDYENFSAKGLGVCLHPNLLRDFRRVLPFGVFVRSLDGVDPILLNDFLSGRVELYVLNLDDMEFVESTIVGGFK